MLMRVILLLSVMTLSACSATGPQFTQLEIPETNKAKVYIYRPWAMLDGAAAPTVQINGKDSFNLSNGGYQVLDLVPGKTLLAVKEGGLLSNWRASPLQISVDLQANKSYFVRLSAELSNAAYVGGVSSVSGQYSWGLVDQQMALTELPKTNKNQ
ncbi:DUF2846 domain-containing protein [Aliiglaciecola sp. CAU 1673]|uniref:DUF2846 domain-containing protein n=1 Tax=Aliiglaciecola sp. CAU 1673 TaxID=3032595 RepID=UPI0023DA7250|nr:DUF2846 domain-containing protein [Aliiglaciecola sp. CAU 1673]MDF2180177.1 DUF2846 domain-containing protein [Aliiglaciecola sp. CAU 1673]